MQIVERFKKRKTMLSAMVRFIRSASCNAQWIRLMVHLFFGTIIVTSFIMIMWMALGGRQRSPEEFIPRCSVAKCRVLCTDLEFYGEQEFEVVNAASEASLCCKIISIRLIRPIFKHAVLPENWLGRIRSNVREVSIVGGNLKEIPPNSFIGPVSNNIKLISLEKIVISTLRDNTFLGLSNLRELYIQDCFIFETKENALQAIDDTLEVLSIRVPYFWNPINVTGSSNPIKLSTVNLSFNSFYDILNNGTLSSLRSCRVLYLNSCKITFLGSGSFDHLEMLEILYLNDNLLVTIPPGLFDKLIATNALRVALHENYWLCECRQNDLRTLHEHDLIMVEPTCYYPDFVSGLTFSEFEDFCNINISVIKENTTIETKKNHHGCISTIVNINEDIDNNISSKMVLHNNNLICKYNRINDERILSTIFQIQHNVLSHSDWISPVFSVLKNQHFITEIVVNGEFGNGLLWYNSLNKNEIYCINTVPDALHVFNAEKDKEYTFCPFNSTTGAIRINKCVTYNFTHSETATLSIFVDILIYISISFVCLVFGATCVFIIIQKNPTLLKRSKRILLVKHKTIDALILPPEVPLRKSTVGNIYRKNTDNSHIFVIPRQDLVPEHFMRSTSMRSSDSNEASYITALSPTEEQLFHWRSNKMAKQPNETPESDYNISPFSSIYESLPYYSLQDKVYETIK